MAHTFTSCLFHCIFSTKERRKSITPELQDRLRPYLGRIARDSNMKALAIGGIDDHVHMLLSLPSTLAIAKAVQILKANSSKWIYETFPQQRGFAWQEGYGAFSIGKSQVPATVKYIESQIEHHRKRTFQEEFLAILAKHEMEYDPRFIWG
jgi:putative transposase